MQFISEKAMATHSSTLAWKIPRMEEPGRLQSIGSLRVGHDWATSLSLFTFMHWRRKWQPTHSSILAWRIPGTEEPSGLLSMGSHRVGHNWSDLAAAAARLSFTSSSHWPPECSNWEHRDFAGVRSHCWVLISYFVFCTVSFIEISLCFLVVFFFGS